MTKRTQTDTSSTKGKEKVREEVSSVEVEDLSDDADDDTTTTTDPKVLDDLLRSMKEVLQQNKEMAQQNKELATRLHSLETRPSPRPTEDETPALGPGQDYTVDYLPHTIRDIVWFTPEQDVERVPLTGREKATLLTLVQGTYTFTPTKLSASVQTWFRDLMTRTRAIAVNYSYMPDNQILPLLLALIPQEVTNELSSKNCVYKTYKELLMHLANIYDLQRENARNECYQAVKRKGTQTATELWNYVQALGNAFLSPKNEESNWTVFLNALPSKVKDSTRVVYDANRQSVDARAKAIAHADSLLRGESAPTCTVCNRRGHTAADCRSAIRVMTTNDGRRGGRPFAPRTRGQQSAREDTNERPPNERPPTQANKRRKRFDSRVERAVVRLMGANNGNAPPPPDSAPPANSAPAHNSAGARSAASNPPPSGR